MKKNILGLLSVMVLMGMVSCSDDNFESKNPVKGGDLIRFSIDQPSTRTVYEAEFGTNAWQIDWMTGDKIRIFCDEAEGKTDAEYSITPTESDHTTAKAQSNYGIVNENEDGLRWNGALINNGDPEHKFYAVYPSTAVRTTTSNGVSSYTRSGNVVDLKLNNNQICTITGTTPGANDTYIAAPDMTNAYMVAATDGIKASQVSSDATGAINLVFSPIMTTLDLVVSYDGVVNGDAKPLNVTGVTVTLPGVPRTAGNCFRYKMANIMSEAGSKGSLVTEGITMSTETFFAGVRYNGGNSLPLQAGQKVKFTLFLPPVEITDANQITVRVNASGSGDYTVKVGAKEKDDAGTANVQYIKGGAKKQLMLPTIKVNADDIKPNNWISQLDDDIYVNQLSIPGTNNSAAYEGYRDRAISQTANIDAQWNAGVRAFEFRSAVTTGLSAIGNSGANERYVNCYDGGYNTGLMLKDALTLVHNKVKGTDEFAIVVCSYQAENLASIGINRLYKYYWYANRRYALFTQYNGMPDAMSGKTEGTGENDWFVPFKPDLTVGECRGKIILINFDEYQNYVGVLVDGAESTDEPETVIETSKNGVDFKSTGSWHTMSKNGTQFDGKIYIQNAFYSAYGNNQTHADKQRYIKAADDEAVKLHTQDTHNWVLNYVGGANSQTTADYQLAAAANNKFYNDYLIGKEIIINGTKYKRAEGPTGIVMVSHQGVQYTSGDTPKPVYGENLPQTIINNNFKFRMQRKGDSN